jgi:hypothetical protein
LADETCLANPLITQMPNDHSPIIDVIWKRVLVWHLEEGRLCKSRQARAQNEADDELCGGEVRTHAIPPGSQAMGGSATQL